MISFERFAQVNGLHFNNPLLLREAMTRRSFLNETDDATERDNERLEFLGDAILSYLTAELLYQRFSDADEGMLTRLRSALVRRETLAEFGRACRIQEVLRVSKGEYRQGAHENVNNLCDAFEALVGALYVDQGLEAARQFAIPRLQAQLELVLADSLDRDARSEFQRLIQNEYGITPNYEIISLTGPEHARVYLMEARVGDIVAGEGEGRSRQVAAQAAATAALARFQDGDLTAQLEALDSTNADMDEEQ